MDDIRIQEALDAAEQGCIEDAIRLLDECLSDTSDYNTRLLAAGSAMEIMLDGEGGTQAVVAGKSPLQPQIQKYARIIVECYDHADKHVRDMVEQFGVYMPNVRRVAENNLDMMQLVIQAKHLSDDGNPKAALEVIDNIIAGSSVLHDRLWAAALATGILDECGSELYTSQAALEKDLLRYAKLTLEFYDETTDQASRQSIEKMVVDFDALRKAVAHMEGGQAQDKQFEHGQSTAKQTGCFIATAAFGTDRHDDVLVLSAFRDNFLLRSAFGRLVVNVYYRFSPSLAAKVEKNAILAWVIRVALLGPASWALRHMLPKQYDRKKGNYRYE